MLRIRQNMSGPLQTAPDTVGEERFISVSDPGLDRSVLSSSVLFCVVLASFNDSKVFLKQSNKKSNIRQQLFVLQYIL